MQRHHFSGGFPLREQTNGSALFRIVTAEQLTLASMCFQGHWSCLSCRLSTLALSEASVPEEEVETRLMHSCFGFTPVRSGGGRTSLDRAGLLTICNKPI